MAQLHMIWPESRLHDPPELVVPEGYRIGPLNPADDAGHVRVMHAAGFASWSAEKLVAWRAELALPDGIFAATCEATGEVVATALASHRPTPLHPAGGELGWVAASPEHAGQGLGRAVSIAALRRLLDAGYCCVYLLTDDHRHAALATYLRLGFAPFICAPDMEGRWRAVCAALSRPCEPGAWVEAPRDLWVEAEAPAAERPGPDQADPDQADPGQADPNHVDADQADADHPDTGRPDSDRIERYTPRHKWLPQREHRGFSCDGDVDAFGDESLYRPSQLGSAAAEPSEVEAGAHSPLTLTFTAGPEGIPAGARVAFVMRGQSPLGKLPEFTLSGPERCALEPCARGFALGGEALAPGDQVTLAFPAFAWTPLSGRREFKVVVRYGDGQPEQRLPAPVAIRVQPRECSRLEAVLPPTHGAGQQVRLRVTARDEFDNRAPFTGSVHLTGLHLSEPGGEQVLPLVDGIGTALVSPPVDGVARARVQAEGAEESRDSNPSVPRDGAQVFVGDLHCHDFLSEAEGYTDQVYAWAIEDRGLDFVSVVPQSHGWHDNETWTVVKYMNERYLDEGRFVPFLGFEWQHSGYGDKVVHYLGGDQPFLPRDDPRYSSPRGLYEALRGSDALVISHHPCYPPGSWCSSTDFDAVETDVERLVELWSMHGSSEGYDPADRPLAQRDPDRYVMAALRRGARLGFTGGSDTHSARPGGSAKEPYPHWGGLTALWADGLTRRDLFAALYARRTYALTRARIVLDFKVNGLPMGAETAACDRAAIEVDAWAPGPLARIEVLKNAALLQSFDQSGDECHLQLEDRTGGPAYYHCRVTMADGNLAVCSPVWLG